MKKKISLNIFLFLIAANAKDLSDGIANIATLKNELNGKL
jgi:hypothetical protein